VASGDFVAIARRNFDFLCDSGFVVAVVGPHSVRYDGGDYSIKVFHDWLSGELCVGFGRSISIDGSDVEEDCQLGALVDEHFPGEGIPVPMTRDPDLIDRFLVERAAWTRRLLPILADDLADTFDRLRRQRLRQVDEADALEIRQRADDAWRRRDYASVALAYEQIKAELPSVELKPSEVKRLSYAHGQLGDT
jgi:hypothetical protein